MKKLYAIAFSILLTIGIVSNAGAWTISLSDAYEDSGYWAYDIIFSGENTDNLNLVGISLGYDTTDVSYSGTICYSYDDGGTPFANDTWVGGGLPESDYPELGIVYSIVGEENIFNPGSFYPVASGETLLFTVYFSTVEGGNFDDTSVYFTYSCDLIDGAVDGVEVNGTYLTDHELTITADTVSAVPVPAAAWLLGSGLVGLVGLRRRNS